MQGSISILYYHIVLYTLPKGMVVEVAEASGGREERSDLSLNAVAVYYIYYSVTCDSNYCTVMISSMMVA